MSVVLNTQFYRNDVVKDKRRPYILGRVLQSQFHKDDGSDDETCEEIKSRKLGLIKVAWDILNHCPSTFSHKWVHPRHLELTDRVFPLGFYVGDLLNESRGVGIMAGSSSTVSIKNVLTGQQLDNISNRDITFFSPFEQDSSVAIVYQDWLGWASNVEYRYILKIEKVSDDDAIIFVDHPQFLSKIKIKQSCHIYPKNFRSKDGTIEVGDVLIGGGHKFMKLTNKINPHLKKVNDKVTARVIRRFPLALEVNWVKRNKNNLIISSIKPPNLLTGAQLRQVKLLPRFLHSLFEIGDRVKLTSQFELNNRYELDDDMAAMSFMYTKEQDETLYPWVITERKAISHVIWQDGHQTHPSLNLFPRQLISDHEIWPGQMITLKLDGSLGQVISVEPKAKTCRVNWSSTHESDLSTCIEGTELSIYQVFPLTELNFYPGDIVTVRPETQFVSQNHSWVGEVTGLVDQGKLEIAWLNGTSSFVNPKELIGVDFITPVDRNLSEWSNEELESLWEDSECSLIKHNFGESNRLSSETEDSFDIESLNTEENLSQSLGSYCSSVFDIKTQIGEGFQMGDTPPEDHKFLPNSRTNNNNSFLKRVSKEHKILKTNLPPTIWARGFSSRLDLLRVIIMGPGGTPFAGGMYQFDLYLDPETFPNKPPQCHYWPRVGVQVGGGDSRPLNPNLYPCGRVCLSLLGTWEGQHPQEQWSAHQSSLLQLLVSLQSLVLVQDPFYNEAGYDKLLGTSEGQKLSNAYNEHAFLLSLQTIPQIIKSPPIPFSSIINQFYHQHLPDIILKCDQLLSKPNSNKIQCLTFIESNNPGLILAQQYFALQPLSLGGQTILQGQLKKLKSVYQDIISIQQNQ